MRYPLAAGLCIITGMGGPTTADAAVPCGARNAPTIARSGPTRVYVGRIRDAFFGEVRHRAVACTRGGHRVPIDDPSDADGNDDRSKVRRRPMVLRHRFVAYVSDEDFSDGEADDLLTTVSVVDLRTRRIRSACPSGDQLGCAHSGTRITDLVLAGNGGFAFMGHRELRSLGSRGRRATLDTGADPGSLRLSGSDLTWTREGVAKRATLR